MQAFGELISDAPEREHVELSRFVFKKSAGIKTLHDLSKLITGLAEQVDREIILLIAEVDASSSNVMVLILKKPRSPKKNGWTW